ncbi:helix-turn-helix transcriptional regulator [Exiguobacterium acetylicum]|uniref:helix-turn-helix transcriptional regulator n=1 Tax=Exiguobacterium acetylicum TaxID=41170 RepID=UPI00397795D1
MKNQVKKMREERGWSQGELAKRLNVSRQTVISIEKERYNPSLDLAFALADLFERRIEDIFTPNRTNEEGAE